MNQMDTSESRKQANVACFGQGTARGTGAIKVDMGAERGAFSWCGRTDAAATGCEEGAGKGGYIVSLMSFSPL